MSLRLIAALALLTLVLPPAAGARVPKRVEPLYQALEAASEGYRAGLAQVRAGRAAEGREAMRQASAALMDGARRCQATRGCEVERFIAAYDALLQQGASALSGDGEGFAETPESAGAAGEGGVLATMPAAGRTVALLNGRDLRSLGLGGLKKCV